MNQTFYHIYLSHLHLTLNTVYLHPDKLQSQYHGISLLHSWSKYKTNRNKMSKNLHLHDKFLSISNLSCQQTKRELHHCLYSNFEMYNLLFLHPLTPLFLHHPDPIIPYPDNPQLLLYLSTQKILPQSLPIRNLF